MKIFDKILKLLFPDKCIICGDVLAEEHDFYICKKCIRLVKFSDEENRCRICSTPISYGSRLCTYCSTRKRYFTKNVSCVIYMGAMRDAVLRYKFNKAVYIRAAFADMIEYAVKKEKDFPHFDLLAAVPSGKKRLKKRGYNQCDYIAKYLSQKWGILYADKELIKIKDTPVQSTMKAATERFENIKGAFKVTDKNVFRGKTVLLLDDVFTTGATLSEISRILLKAGAKEVYTATVAVSHPKDKIKY